MAAGSCRTLAQRIECVDKGEEIVVVADGRFKRKGGEE